MRGLTRGLIRRGFSLLTVGGIRISINYTWFIVLGLVIWSMHENFRETYGTFGAATIWACSVAYALLLFASVLLHELSHSFVGNRLGLGIKGITLFIFGGIAELGKEPEDPGTEIKVAAAGPACSLVLSFFFYGLSVLLYALQGRSSAVTFQLFHAPALDSPFVALFKYLGYANAALLLFNLVPGFPLDGGRLLRAILWKRSGDVGKSTRFASNLGKGFAVLLIVLGLLVIFVMSDFTGAWLVLVGLFLQQAAEGSYQHVLVRKALSGVKVRETMSTDVVYVSPSLTLDVLVESFFFRFRFSSFPVVDGETLVGVVDLSHVKHIPREQWHLTRTSDVMAPVSEELVVRPEDEAVDALAKMIKNGLGKLPVVVGGRLVGILTRGDVMSLLRMRTDLGA
ncbi:MAG: site-2 protease family protein [Candidatus Eisenbacteria bacterium]|nr:site-2 protease family protein [Candidatus Eisenbacteria bacterium]